MATPMPENSGPTRDDPPQIAFLHTAIVKAINGDHDCTATVAFDTGSASSLVTETLAAQLKLKRHHQRLSLSGPYGEGTSRNFVSTTLHSIHDPNQLISLKLSVVPKLPQAFPPNQREEIVAVPHLKDLQLADPAFGGPLDILIGSLDYGRCVRGSLTYNLTSDLAALPTIFLWTGWTVTGPLDYTPPASITLKIGSTDNTSPPDLSQLWELDMTPEVTSSSRMEDASISHFLDTHSVSAEGRYAVQLPRVPNPPELGQSRTLAVQRFLSNERSLRKQKKLEEFEHALQEYLTLGHAEEVPPDDLQHDHYYLPVHSVFKSSSTTTKVRPVFDASARTSSGSSLNDTLEPGPNLYSLLTDILLKFRKHTIAFSADISKMFREIELQPQKRDLHRFLLRKPSGTLADCRMRRVTFGVRSSPLLATQVIRHLASQHTDSHPEASRAILECFYVDDFISGSETVKDAIRLREQLCDLLCLAKMTLRKWRTNHAGFRETIPDNLIELEDLQLTSPRTSLKTLGLHWSITNDSIHVATPNAIPENTTKRVIASIVGKVFDILGMYSPFTILAKLLLRRLWQLKVSWDELLPDDIVTEWKAWTSQLPSLKSQAIPRKYSPCPELVIHTALHGFSDASNDAYGAVVYVRQLHRDGCITTSLVISKARVAPLKSLTILRAELAGAYLLAKLLSYSAHILCVTEINAWTDSAIVLCWLRKVPSSLNVFVGNRVAAIHELLLD